MPAPSAISPASPSIGVHPAVSSKRRLLVNLFHKHLRHPSVRNRAEHTIRVEAGSELDGVLAVSAAGSGIAFVTERMSAPRGRLIFTPLEITRRPTGAVVAPVPDCSTRPSSITHVALRRVFHVFNLPLACCVSVRYRTSRGKRLRHGSGTAMTKNRPPLRRLRNTSCWLAWFPILRGAGAPNRVSLQGACRLLPAALCN
jgi:hypothetical protein